MDKPETLGDRIRLLRHARRWSQRKLSNELVCSRTTVANWENGINTPSKYGIAKLARVFGVTVEELECK